MMAGTIQKTTIPIFLLTFISFSPVLICGSKRQFNRFHLKFNKQSQTPVNSKIYTNIKRSSKEKTTYFTGKCICKNKIRIIHFKLQTSTKNDIIL